MGLAVGLLPPTWHAAVEGAQAVAGLVAYPPGNPYHYYLTKVWTILNQIPAILLRLGAPEPLLCVGLSGLLGMLSFQALAACVLAISLNVRLAIASPLLIYLTDTMGWGISYPINLLHSSHTYGIAGLSSIVLAAGLLAAGSPRAGGFLVGLAPSVHPALGAFINGVALVNLALDRRFFSSAIRAAAGPILMGYAASAASLGFHLLWTRQPFSSDPHEIEVYQRVFFQFWDSHRGALPSFSAGMVLAMINLVVSLSALRRFRGNLSRPSLFLLRGFAFSVIAGGGTCAVCALLPDRVPLILTALMPARLMNFAVIGTTALIIGLWGRGLDQPWARLNLAFLFGAATAVKGLSVLRGFDPQWPLTSAIGLSAALLLATMPSEGDARLRPWVGTWSKAEDWASRAKDSIFRDKRTSAVPIAVLALIALCVSILPGRWTRLHDVVARGRESMSDPVLERVSEGQGLLLTASDLHLVQLRTRRPVLIDGHSLDMLAYAPEMGPAVSRILREVYGVDFMHPPENLRHRGSLVHGTAKGIWESRTLEDWQEIRKRFLVTGVLTYEDWKLALPLVTRGPKVAYYRIPASTEGEQ